MKLIIDLEKHRLAKDGDILVCKKDGFSTMKKDAFLDDVLKKLEEISGSIKSLAERVENLEKQLRIDHGEEVEEDELE